jgi:hypothetical protein
METLQRLHNRGSISTGYDVDNSVKLEKNNDTTTIEFFERNVSSAGSRTTGTFSAWIKKTDITTAQYLFTFGNVDNDNGRTFARFQTDGTLRIGGGSTVWRNTNRVFRDTSAWYHIVIAIDTTQSTADNRFKIYVNGVQETSFSTTNNPSEDGTLGLNFGKQAIGYNTVDNNSGFNGYMSEVVIQDGVASAPTEFGEFDSSGIWIPKDASDATMGTNGSYLKFENAGSMGAATAGNSFTVQNINQNDQATDTPTNNFATLNPLHYTTKYTITEGATRQNSSANGWGTSVGSIGVTSGKWYFEIKTPDTNGYTTFGAIDADSILNQYLNGDAHAGDAPYGISYYGGNGGIIVNGSYISGTSFPSYTTEIMGCALDLDNNKIYFSKSGTYGNSGNPVTGANGMDLPTGGSGTWFFSTSTYSEPLDTNHGGYTSFTISSAATDADGYGTFEYAPPSGYYALCTKNLEVYG